MQAGGIPLSVHFILYQLTPCLWLGWAETLMEALEASQAEESGKEI